RLRGGRPWAALHTLGSECRSGPQAPPTVAQTWPDGTLRLGTPQAPSRLNSAPIVLNSWVRQRTPRWPLFQGLFGRCAVNRLPRAVALAVCGLKPAPNSSASVGFAPGTSLAISAFSGATPNS